MLVFLSALAWRAERERRQMAAAEKAKEELIFALQLTSVELQQTRAKLLRQIGGGGNRI
jgi:hypothetical protein